VNNSEDVSTITTHNSFGNNISGCAKMLHVFSW